MDVDRSCYIFEKHTIQEKLCGNGIGLITKSDDTDQTSGFWQGYAWRMCTFLSACKISEQIFCLHKLFFSSNFKWNSLRVSDFLTIIYFFYFFYSYFSFLVNLLAFSLQLLKKFRTWPQSLCIDCNLGTLFKLTVFYACFCLKIEIGLIDPDFRVLVY